MREIGEEGKRKGEEREREKKWKKANLEKLREQKRRYRERQKAKARGFLIDDRVHPSLRVSNAHKDLLDVALKRLKKNKLLQRKRKEKKQTVSVPVPCFYCTQKKPVQPVSTAQPVQTAQLVKTVKHQ